MIFFLGDIVKKIDPFFAVCFSLFLLAIYYFIFWCV